MEINVEKKSVGRPKSDDPKMKFDSIRLKTSTIIDIELIAEHLGIKKSSFVRDILEIEVEKQKKILKL